MGQKITVTESQLKEMVVNAINEQLGEGFFGDMAHNATNWARRTGRKAEKFGNKIDDFNTNVANGVKNGVQAAGNAVKSGAQTVGNAAKSGAQAVGNAAKNGAQAVKQGAQNVKQGASDWASLNKRVTAIEQQLGMRKAMEESIEEVVNKVINEMIKK